MTYEQIIALAIICAFVAGLSAFAYRLGVHKGAAQGSEQKQSEQSETIHNLNTTLLRLKAQQMTLALQRQTENATSPFNMQHRQVLLQIAENLRISAETFSAFKTGKKLERDARTLRDQALIMAALIQPLDQEDAA